MNNCIFLLQATLKEANLQDTTISSCEQAKENHLLYMSNALISLSLTIQWKFCPLLVIASTIGILAEQES
jgi:hypothetical protein